MKLNGNTALLLLGGAAVVAAGVMVFNHLQNQQLLSDVTSDSNTGSEGVSQVPGGIQVIDGTWIKPLPSDPYGENLPDPDPYQGYQDYRNGERMAY